MKYTTIIVLLFGLFSCGQPASKVAVEKVVNTKFELFLIDFMKRNPNYLNNQNTKNETSKIFKKELIEFLKNNDSVFYYHPLQLSQTSNDGKYGLFRIWGTDKIKDSQKESLYQDCWYVDVLVELSKSQKDTFFENNYYRIIGKFNRYIKENDSEFNEIKSWTFEPNVSKDELVNSETLKFNIGCLNIKQDKIEKINGNEHDGDYYNLRISNQ
jgi:hypothetical protein